MRVDSTIVTLKKALDQKPADANAIHHSDKGLHYCYKEYLTLLQQ